MWPALRHQCDFGYGSWGEYSQNTGLSNGRKSSLWRTCQGSHIQAASGFKLSADGGISAGDRRWIYHCEADGKIEGYSFRRRKDSDEDAQAAGLPVESSEDEKDQKRLGSRGRYGRAGAESF